MWKEIGECLRSKDASDRTRGWMMVREHNRSISSNNLNVLRKHLVQEGDDRTLRVATTAVLSLLLVQQMSEEARAELPPASLSDWLWKPFLEPALVLRAHQKFQPRDEDAVIELARFLSFQYFPRVAFMRVPIDRAQWHDTLENRQVRTYCLVGRLNMYGAKAMDEFGSSAVRYTFPDMNRPYNLARGNLHDKYHCIQQRSGNRIVDVYKTHEREGKRTDYALVQRYVTRQRTVVLIAGCSALGTLGAVQWVSGIAGSGFALPDEPPGADTPFEALLQVRGDIPKVSIGWQPEPAVPLKMYLGNYEWLEDKGGWSLQAPDQLIFLYRKNDLKAIQSSDGRLICRGASKPADLLEAIYKLSRGRRSGKVPLSELGDHPALRDARSTRQNFRRMDARLRGAITINQQQGWVRLNVPVAIRELAASPKTVVV